jgi:hypothetical protein
MPKLFQSVFERICEMQALSVAQEVHTFPNEHPSSEAKAMGEIDTKAVVKDWLASKVVANEELAWRLMAIVLNHHNP